MHCETMNTTTLMVSVSFVVAAVTDVGISAILTYCTQLQEANFAGIKQITSDNFLPIISGKFYEQNLPRIQYENATVTEICNVFIIVSTDVQRWKRSQALLRLKLHEKRTLDDHYSSDEVIIL